jgi:ABC-type lipoprotein export system ATPase subunit
MLTLEGITKSYRGPIGPVPVLRDFALQLEPGDFVAVRGPSGCGKTTLLLIAGGLADAGRVMPTAATYALSPVAAPTSASRVRFVFQQFHLCPTSAFSTTSWPGSPQSYTTPAAAGSCRPFGLADRRRHLPGQLSTGGGMHRLARLLPRQKVTADEPTGNLDDASSDTVYRKH